MESTPRNLCHGGVGSTDAMIGSRGSGSGVWGEGTGSAGCAADRAPGLPLLRVLAIGANIGGGRKDGLHLSIRPSCPCSSSAFSMSSATPCHHTKVTRCRGRERGDPTYTHAKPPVACVVARRGWWNVCRRWGGARRRLTTPRRFEHGFRAKPLGGGRANLRFELLPALVSASSPPPKLPPAGSASSANLQSPKRTRP